MDLLEVAVLWICSDTTPANRTAATSFNGPGVHPTDRPVGDNRASAEI